jgi:MFS superfamily sulfate permease-like transporter
MGSPANPAAGQAAGSLKALVAFTPLAGALLVPVVVPLLMVRVSVAAGVLAAVLLSCLWFAAMLRTSELPSHG